MKTNQRITVHVIWHTWRNVPWISPEVERVVHAAVREQAERLRCGTFAVESALDHTHGLFRLHPSTALSDLVRAIKSASAFEVGRRFTSDTVRRWQSGYGAFSVDRANEQRVMNYVLNQKRHHQQRTTLERLERTDDPID